MKKYNMTSPNVDKKNTFVQPDSKVGPQQGYRDHLMFMKSSDAKASKSIVFRKKCNLNFEFYWKWIF
jgi:hypothetical protein